ncbi:MAG: hypothetical protein P4M09_16915 [Devosia sp.]|nr:hypothetical protein [Devosia sp.]
MKKLVVTEVFLAYQVGDQVSDSKAVEAILAGEHRNRVVAIADDKPVDVIKPAAPTK